MRRMRFTRKVMLQEWSYFCTFTYSDELQSEDSFKKSLRNCLKHLSSRKGWKYAGVWERSPENNRLHFHALVYVPQGQMIGQIEERKDFDTRKNKMQVIHVNTHFEKKYGRNDFKAVVEQDKGQCLKYMMKYLQKSNERIVYSRNLPTYFVCNVDDQDVVCEVTSKYNYKIILFDDFTCWDKDWCYVGTVSKEVIELLPKAS